MNDPHHQFAVVDGVDDAVVTDAKATTLRL